MAQITKAIAEHHRFTAQLVPEQVRKGLDQEEFLDRIVHAEDLSRRAGSATDPVLRRGYATVAKAVLAARPRADVEREVAALHARAAGMPAASSSAEALRRKAESLLAEHPPAPRRGEVAAQAVAKAVAAGGGDELTPLYDATGRLVGVCPASKIMPVGDISDVAKARAGKVRRPARVAPGRR